MSAQSVVVFALLLFVLSQLIMSQGFVRSVVTLPFWLSQTVGPWRALSCPASPTTPKS